MIIADQLDETQQGLDIDNSICRSLRMILKPQEFKPK